jgi:hypothetical protein
MIQSLNEVGAVVWVLSAADRDRYYDFRRWYLDLVRNNRNQSLRWYRVISVQVS